MRDWTEVGFSSIYYLLNKLEKDNLIEGHIERHIGQGVDRLGPEVRTDPLTIEIDVTYCPASCF